MWRCKGLFGQGVLHDVLFVVSLVQFPEAIREHQRLMKLRRNPGYRKGLLFPDNNGDYRLPSSVGKGWKFVSESMTLPWVVTPHDLRRSYQNLLRQASVNMVVQQALMGHSSDAMTQHYSHVDMEEKRKAHDGVISLLQHKEKKANGE